MANIKLEIYSDASFVLRGSETKDYKEKIKELGGRWNAKLRGGRGWIFSNKREKSVKEWLDSIGKKKSKSQISQELANNEILKKITELEIQVKKMSELIEKVTDHLDLDDNASPIGFTGKTILGFGDSDFEELEELSDSTSAGLPWKEIIENTNQ